MKKFVVGLGILAAVIGILTMMPDFARYMKIRAM